MARLYMKRTNEEIPAYFAGGAAEVSRPHEGVQVVSISSLTIFTLSSSTSLDLFNCFTGKPMRISTTPTGTT